MKDRGRLHNISVHHEIFRLVRLADPESDSEHRSRLIDAVLAYRWPNESDKDKERRAAYHHFTWLDWLHRAAPSCAVTRQALDAVLVKYPDFKPREHPDLTHWTGPVEVGPQSPFTVEQLLAKPAVDWLPYLSAFQPSEFVGPDRDGLVYTVAAAVRQKPEWRFDPANALAEAGRWDSDLGSSLIHAWSETELGCDRHDEVLKWLGKLEPFPKHGWATFAWIPILRPANLWSIARSR